MPFSIRNFRYNPGHDNNYGCTFGICNEKAEFHADYMLWGEKLANSEHEPVVICPSYCNEYHFFLDKLETEFIMEVPYSDGQIENLRRRIVTIE